MQNGPNSFDDFASQTTRTIEDIRIMLMLICAALKATAPETAVLLEGIISSTAGNLRKAGQSDALLQECLAELQSEYPPQPLPEPSKPTLHLVRPDPDGS